MRCNLVEFLLVALTHGVYGDVIVCPYVTDVA